MSSRKSALAILVCGLGFVVGSLLVIGGPLGLLDQWWLLASAGVWTVLLAVWAFAMSVEDVQWVYSRYPFLGRNPLDHRATYDAAQTLFALRAFSVVASGLVVATGLWRLL